jgi:hypothetical protein
MKSGTFGVLLPLNRGDQGDKPSAGRSRLTMARAFLLLLLVVVALAPAASTVRAAGPAGPGAGQITARALGAGSRIPWQDGEWYLHGANVPWLTWAKDFGGNDDGGVSSQHSRQTIRDTFGAVKGHGTNVVRWWVFEGDAWQITRDGSGMPTGLDQKIYRDFDAALQGCAAGHRRSVRRARHQRPGRPSPAVLREGVRWRLAVVGLRPFHPGQAPRQLERDADLRRHPRRSGAAHRRLPRAVGRGSVQVGAAVHHQHLPGDERRVV